MNTVPKLWPGCTMVLLGAGPSLTREDVESVKGRARVLAINRTFELAPWADVFYSADEKPFRWYADLGLRECQGLKYSLTNGVQKMGVTLLRRGLESGLSLDPNVLHTGKNSGYSAINLAVHLGATRIVLLGYDMQRGPKGEEHYHADHPNKSRAKYEVFQSFFPSLVEPLQAAGVSIANCSRRTALECFPRMQLDAALREAVAA